MDTQILLKKIRFLVREVGNMQGDRMKYDYILIEVLEK